MPSSPASSKNSESYGSTFWAAQNPWFRKFSLLGGALGEREKTRFVSPGQPDPKAAVNTIAELGGEEPVFCKVGDCLYWHTDPKQVKRHRNDHFWYRHSYLCPNQTDTCPHLGSDFRRREAVNAHCKRFSTCGDFLEANGGIIRRWGTPVTEQELRPYDPNFHKPYEIFDGRTGHSGGRGHY